MGTRRGRRASPPVGSEPRNGRSAMIDLGFGNPCSRYARAGVRGEMRINGSSARRRLGTWLAAAALALDLSAMPARAEAVRALWDGTSWGERSSALLARFDGRATVLPRPIDFGHSYADVVLRGTLVGRYPLVAFFQRDTMTGGLKRIQLERQRP